MQIFSDACNPNNQELNAILFLLFSECKELFKEDTEKVLIESINHFNWEYNDARILRVYGDEK